MKKIALISIDNRPVCYDLPRDIAAIDDELEIILPDKKLLGGLRSYADVDGLMEWLDKIGAVDAIVVSLDTIAYGGLISSRRCESTLEEIQARLDKFKEAIKKKQAKVYAFSSIMRISNNNVNEEEKEYWKDYGKKIFEYSYDFHKNGEGADIAVPLKILEDYIKTRKRNFEINKIYLDWFEQGIFDMLIFSKDDCAQYGLNVMEAETLQKIIDDKEIPALIKTGADEIPLTLFARAVRDLALSENSEESANNRGKMKIAVRFLAPEHKKLISNYEDISIEKSVLAQLDLAGCTVLGVSEADADLILVVNNFEGRQGEIVMDVLTKPFEGELKLPWRPFMVADVRFANGADNSFVDKLFQSGINFEKFYGYSAWNTSANSLGSLICAAVVRFFAQKYNEKAFKKLQVIRFLDDWAYQANVRQMLKNISQTPDLVSLKQLMFPFQKRLGISLHSEIQADYSFPWDRFFEIGIEIKEGI